MFSFFTKILLILQLPVAIGQGVNCPSLSIYQSSYGVCLMAAGLLVDWETAENLCIYQGGHLFNVGDKNTNDYLIKFINVFGEGHNDFYIGYEYKNSEWQWTDGLTSSFQNFEDGQVPNEGDVAWVYANKTAVDSGKWFSGQGNRNLPFLCEIPPCSRDRILSAEINGTHIRYDSVFQKYYFGNNLITGSYKKSFQECLRLSGFLPVIEDTEENESVRNMMKELLPDVQQALLGLTYESHEWKWIRTNSTFVNWASGEPRIQDSSAAVVMSLDSGLFHTVPNTEEHHLICSAWKTRELC